MIFSPSLTHHIEERGIIAVLVIHELEHAIPLAEALLSGGVDTLELTLRTPASITALHRIASRLPEVTVGAGTLLNAEQVNQAVDAGAAFGVAPGLNPEVVSAARRAGLSFAPGVMTPSEIEHAAALGCKLMKLFPAQSLGGLSYLKTVSAPYAHLGLKFIPLGGISQEHLPAWAVAPEVAAVGGSWLAPHSLIQAEDWSAITERARLATQAIASARLINVL